MRRPDERIADCCWLPRLVDKARLFDGGSLPLLYRAAFGSRIGVDGYFMQHFSLTRRELLVAVSRNRSDDEVARWFLSLDGVSAERISVWNELAPRLGEKGQPGFLTRHLVKFVMHPKSVRNPVGSIFEAIYQDEGSAPPDSRQG